MRGQFPHQHVLLCLCVGAHALTRLWLEGLNKPNFPYGLDVLVFAAWVWTSSPFSDGQCILDQIRCAAD